MARWGESEWLVRQICARAAFFRHFQGVDRVLRTARVRDSDGYILFRNQACIHLLDRRIDGKRVSGDLFWSGENSGPSPTGLSCPKQRVRPGWQRQCPDRSFHDRRFQDTDCVLHGTHGSRECFLHDSWPALSFGPRSSCTSSIGETISSASPILRA